MDPWGTPEIDSSNSICDGLIFVLSLLLLR